MEGQGETKLRFYRGLGASAGTGRDRERHPVAVRIAVKICARKCNFPGGIERDPEREGPSIHSRPCFQITEHAL